MTATETMERIKREYMDAYNEWLNDRFDLSDMEYGKKYGWRKSERLMNLKDGIAAIKFFQAYIFTGRYLPAWEKLGYESKEIWELHRIGFLSYKMYSNWDARASGRTDFYFLSQKTAVQIYKETKGIGK